MSSHRAEGQVQPGIRWGPFTLRIPFYHFGMEWPEAIQGFFIAGATGLALIPIMQREFALNYDVALAIVIVQSLLIANAPTLFGDPYCHGWVTPAIPLVLFAIAGLRASAPEGSDVTLEVIQTVTAFTLLCAAFFLIAGLTGVGRVIVQKVPNPLKAGIIFGAAIAAFQHEFGTAEIGAGIERVRIWFGGAVADGQPGIEELDAKIAASTSYFDNAMFASIAAIGICLLLMFSLPLEKLKHRYRWVAVIAGLGLAPGFLVGAIVGQITGEVQFAVEGGLESPQFGTMYQSLSPLAIGWPSFEMFVAMLPLAFMVYIIGFGDIVTGNELLREASRHRPDEAIDINATRTHYNIGIRNAIQALVAGPFPVTHGPLWTGVHVVVTERYKQGRSGMDTIYGGISAYYFWGIPLLLFLRPITSFLQPLLPVALTLTLILTGFACGYVAMALPRNAVERGVAMTTGMMLALFGAWQGLLCGVLMTLLISGWKSDEYQEYADA